MEHGFSSAALHINLFWMQLYQYLLQYLMSLYKACIVLSIGNRGYWWKKNMVIDEKENTVFVNQLSWLCCSIMSLLAFTSWHQSKVTINYVCSGSSVMEVWACCLCCSQELQSSILSLATKILVGCDEVLETLQQVTTALINSDIPDRETRWTIYCSFLISYVLPLNCLVFDYPLFHIFHLIFCIMCNLLLNQAVTFRYSSKFTLNICFLSFCLL